MKSFPQIATTTAPTMQIVQMQCPEGVSPGQTMQANINGQSLGVQIPDGVAPGTMFQVRHIQRVPSRNSGRAADGSCAAGLCPRTCVGPGADHATGTRFPCVKPSDCTTSVGV